MDKTLGGYFVLPKREVAKALQPQPRDFPTTEQVLLILASMARATLNERRDRAIVAASFQFGTRASATASLRLKHVDVKARKVYQDATVVRVKNSKSQTTCWFPIGDPAEEIVKAWIEELLQLGCTPEDALFPPDAVLSSPHLLATAARMPIEPWKTEGAIRRAFRSGCSEARLPYFNPHSARHYLKSIRDDFCRTLDQRKAWSHNMGHENEQITEANYAKMTDQRRDEIFGGLSAGRAETEDELWLLLAYYERRLPAGTPEFERAHQLFLSRLEQQGERST